MDSLVRLNQDRRRRESRYETTVASNPETFEACCRLRYDVYVSEMRRKQRHADHDNRKICDPLDRTGVTFACRDAKAELVGTIRCNHVRDGFDEVSPYLALYEIEQFADLQSTAITTRLMVKPRHRNLEVLTSLVCAAYRHSLAAGMTNDFMDCNHPLPALATTFGYVVHRDSVNHREYGDVCVMRLRLTDHDHLRQVNSPFSKILQSN